MTLILFDIDGTLAATNFVDAKCYAIAFEQVFGFPIPTTDWSVYTHVTDTGIIHETLEKCRGSRASQQEMDLFERTFVAALEEEWKENPGGFAQVPGAKAALDRIAAAADIKAALATGGMRDSALYKLTRAGFDVASLVGGFANDSETREGIADCAIARANGHDGDIVYVGDGSWDVFTSAAKGFRFVGIAGDACEQKLRAAGAKAILHDFSDLDAFFDAVRTAEVPKARR